MADMEKPFPHEVRSSFISDLVEARTGYAFPRLSRGIATTLSCILKRKHPDVYEDLATLLQYAPGSGSQDISSCVEQIKTHKQLIYTVEGKEYVTGDPGIIVANHPIGLLEGMVLYDLLRDAGRRCMFVTSNRVAFVDRDHRYIIPLKRQVDLSDLYRQVKEKLASGYDIVILPAGDLSTYHPSTQSLQDPRRSRTPVLWASQFQVPIYPIYIEIPSNELVGADLFEKPRSYLGDLKLNLGALLEDDFVNGFTVRCRQPLTIQDCGYDQPGVPANKATANACAFWLQKYTYGELSEPDENLGIEVVSPSVVR